MNNSYVALTVIVLAVLFLFVFVYVMPSQQTVIKQVEPTPETQTVVIYDDQPDYITSYWPWNYFGYYPYSGSYYDGTYYPRYYYPNRYRHPRIRNDSVSPHKFQTYSGHTSSYSKPQPIALNSKFNTGYRGSRPSYSGGGYSGGGYKGYSGGSYKGYSGGGYKGYSGGGGRVSGYSGGGGRVSGYSGGGGGHGGRGRR